MLCQGCERGDHENCGMQTWCSCDCEGPDGFYSYMPEDYYFQDDLDGGRLVKKDRREEADKQSYDDLAASGGIVDAP